jgi:hypothetical protein
MPWKPDNPLISNNLSPETQIKPVMYFFALEYFRSFSPFFFSQRKKGFHLSWIRRSQQDADVKKFQKKIDKKSP